MSDNCGRKCKGVTRRRLCSGFASWYGPCGDGACSECYGDGVCVTCVGLRVLPVYRDKKVYYRAHEGDDGAELCALCRGKGTAPQEVADREEP